MSSLLFFAFVLFIAVQRLLEVRLSARNEKNILAAGGKEHAPGHFIAMKLIHTTWLIAMPLEVIYCDRQFSWSLFVPALVLTLAGQLLRYLAISTLKSRWTVRIMTIPHAAPVHAGIYQYVKHPNYVGVVLELFAIPLLHGAYLSSLIFSGANALLLCVRIREEERALSRENNYGEYFRTSAQ